jgi:hypothetical protein
MSIKAYINKTKKSDGSTHRSFLFYMLLIVMGLKPVVIKYYCTGVILK